MATTTCMLLAKPSIDGRYVNQLIEFIYFNYNG